jgi:hypothetical protein
MNYQKIYDQIVERAQKENRFKGKGIYFESHHIIPKCLGGSNERENLILLTAREHFLCHWLLTRIYSENAKLIYAFWAMCNQTNNRKQSRYKPSSHIYQESKEKFSLLHSNTLRGQKRKPRSIETRNLISNRLKGIKKSESTINKLKKPKKTIKCPHCHLEGSVRNMKYYHFDNCKVITGIDKFYSALRGPLKQSTKDKIKEKLSGRIVPQEVRDKISNSTLGKPKSKKHKI